MSSFQKKEIEEKFPCASKTLHFLVCFKSTSAAEHVNYICRYMENVTY